MENNIFGNQHLPAKLEREASFGTLASISDIDGTQIDSSDLHLQETDQGLDKCDGASDESHQLEEPHSKEDRALCKMEQIKSSIESFISNTHCKQDWLVSVVQLHDGIVCSIHVFVIVATGQE